MEKENEQLKESLKITRSNIDLLKELKDHYSDRCNKVSLELEDLKEGIKSLQRLDVENDHDGGVLDVRYDNGDYVEWSDIEKLLNK